MDGLRRLIEGRLFEPSFAVENGLDAVAPRGKMYRLRMLPSSTYIYKVIVDWTRNDSIH